MQRQGTAAREERSDSNAALHRAASPGPQGRPITFDLPDIGTASDITKALGMIAKAMAAGELTPDEADTVATVIEAHRKAIETAELEDRIRRLEARLGQ
jgi:hypothetical protein